MVEKKQHGEPRSIKVYRGLIVAALVVSASIFLISGGLFIYEGLDKSWEVGGPAEFGYFGSFVGGVLGPAVAASSLLLILKTLKVQMDEMKQTNESLALSAQLNKDNIEQQRNSFVISWSTSQLRMQKIDEISEIKYKYVKLSQSYDRTTLDEIVTSGPAAEFITPKTGLRENLKPLKGEEIHIEEYLIRLAHFSSDAIDYLNTGGIYHYKKNEISRLLTLLKPFGQEQSSLIDDLQKLELNGFVEPLSSAYQKIDGRAKKHDQALLNQLASKN